jgi:hypothetical protein
MDGPRERRAHSFDAGIARGSEAAAIRPVDLAGGPERLDGARPPQQLCQLCLDCGGKRRPIARIDTFKHEALDMQMHLHPPHADRPSSPEVSGFSSFAYS